MYVHAYIYTIIPVYSIEYGEKIRKGDFQLKICTPLKSQVSGVAIFYYEGHLKSFMYVLIALKKIQNHNTIHVRQHLHIYPLLNLFTSTFYTSMWQSVAALYSMT